MKKFNSFLLGGALALLGAGTAYAQAAKTVPYSSPITVSSSEFDEGWTQIDANNDADGTRGIWGPASRSGYSNPNSNGSAARYYSFSNQDPADDYLVSPAIHLEQGTEYVILYGIATESTSYPKNVYLFASTTNTAEAFQATEPLQYLEQYKDNYFKTQTVNFTPDQDGDYYFAIYTNSPNQNYYLFAATFAVYKNEFTPAGVTNLKAERNPDRTQIECTLSWTLPTKDTFGQDFAEGVTVEQVNLYRDGSPRPFKTLEGAQTEYVDNTEDGLEPGIHTYEVEVVVDGATSPKASVTSKYVGPVTPATLPHTWVPSDASAFEDWVVLKGEGSQNTGNWSLYTYSTPNYARYTCQTGKAEDDYLVAPPFAITKAGYYKVTYTGNPSNNAYTSNVELRYGTAPTIDALQNTICERIGFTSNNKDEYSYVVKINEPGTYYFAAVATNPNPDYGIYIYAYSIGVEETEKTPAAVTDLTATPDPDFNLEVVLNWTCPTTSSNGEALENSEYQIEVYKGTELLATLPGGTSTYTDNAIEQPGVYSYSVKTVANSETASSAGAVNVTSKWVGPHLVSLPYSTSFSTSDTTVAIWDIYDANNDGKTWHYYSNSYRCWQSDEAGEADGTRKYDDYFLTPYFDMTPGYYKVTFKPVGGNASKPMTHNVGFVKAGSFIPSRPDLQQPQQYTSNTTSTYSAKVETYIFKIEEAGQYQIVFAAIGEQPVVTSLSDSYSFYGFTEFTAAEYPVLPAVATDLTVTPAENEVLEATLTWVNPTETNVEGVALEAITKAVIIRDGEEVAEMTEGLTPGESASFTDSKATGLTPGKHTYSVEIYNASGKSADAAPVVISEWIGGGLEAPQTWDGGEAFEEWTLIDNGNGSTYGDNRWYISGSTALRAQSNAGGEDDWAISPNISFKKGYSYSLEFEHYLGASFRDYVGYTFDVYVGAGSDTDKYIKIGSVVSNDAAAMASSPEVTTLNIDCVDGEAVAVSDEDGETVTIPAGTFAIAFHATQKGGVFVRKLDLQITKEPAPAEANITPAYYDFNNSEETGASYLPDMFVSSFKQPTQYNIANNFISENTNKGENYFTSESLANGKVLFGAWMWAQNTNIPKFVDASQIYDFGGNIGKALVVNGMGSQINEAIQENFGVNPQMNVSDVNFGGNISLFWLNNYLGANGEIDPKTDRVHVRIVLNAFANDMSSGALFSEIKYQYEDASAFGATTPVNFADFADENGKWNPYRWMVYEFEVQYWNIAAYLRTVGPAFNNRSMLIRSIEFYPVSIAETTLTPNTTYISWVDYTPDPEPEPLTIYFNYQNMGSAPVESITFNGQTFTPGEDDWFGNYGGDITIDVAGATYPAEMTINFNSDVTVGSVTAQYNTEDGMSSEFVGVEGHQAILTQVPAGLTAMYVNLDEQAPAKVSFTIVGDAENVTVQYTSTYPAETLEFTDNTYSGVFSPRPNFSVTPAEGYKVTISCDTEGASQADYNLSEYNGATSIYTHSEKELSFTITVEEDGGSADDGLFHITLFDNNNVVNRIYFAGEDLDLSSPAIDFSNWHAGYPADLYLYFAEGKYALDVTATLVDEAGETFAAVVNIQEGYAIVQITENATALEVNVSEGYKVTFALDQESMAYLEYAVLTVGYEPATFDESTGSFSKIVGAGTEFSISTNDKDYVIAKVEANLEGGYQLNGPTQDNGTASGYIFVPEGDLTFTITINQASGVFDVEFGFNEDARYFDMQGVEVTNPAAGNFYIKVEGNRATKVLVK